MSMPVFILPWWGYLLAALALTHVTIISVTVYLHRHQAHRAVELHPVLSHFFRFWLWLTTATITREWVAVHRKHHARVESVDDPHSPQVHGIARVLFGGALLYRREANNRQTLEQFGHGCPDDALEKRLYTPLTYAGPVLMLAVDLVLFGPAWGFGIWITQMLWIPFWAAGVINGVGHYLGYRNFETRDASRNIIPWGLIIGGEELHNNHHAYASSARLSVRPWEFDIGWAYLCFFRSLGLARINRTFPRLLRVQHKARCDADTVRAITANRIQVMADFISVVIKRLYREEFKSLTDNQQRNRLKRFRRLLHREYPAPDQASLFRLNSGLENWPRLKTAYQMKVKLQEIWNAGPANQESLVTRLEEWCRQAEASGIQVLEEFSSRLRGYTLAAAS